MLFKVTLSNDQTDQYAAYLLWASDLAHLSLLGIPALSRAAIITTREVSIDDFLWPRYRALCRAVDQMTSHNADIDVLNALQEVMETRANLRRSVDKIDACDDIDETIILSTTTEF